ncbi:UNVERIFIED_CONTAM: hypothetical protein FKN15_057571 [Acipenser sinensis]
MRDDVCAEAFNPDEEEEDTEPRVVHPKTDEQRCRLQEACLDILLFKSLDPEQMSQVLDAMFEHRVQPQEHVIDQGDDGDNFYTKADQQDNAEVEIARCSHGQYFGELALVTNKPRAASAYAVGGVKCLRQCVNEREEEEEGCVNEREEEEEGVKQLTGQCERERGGGGDETAHRTVCEREREEEEEGMKQLTGQCERERRRRGGVYDILVQKGEQSVCVGQYNNRGSFGELALMYNTPRAATIIATTEGALWGLDRVTFRRLVLKNNAKKRKTYETFVESVPLLKSLETKADQQDNAEVEIARCSHGQYFGELALVTNKPRAASAYAVGGVKCLIMDIQAFERLLGSCKEIMKRNISHYEEQLDRVTFRRLVLKNNAKKRKTYETFVESVPLLKSLEDRVTFRRLVLKNNAKKRKTYETFVESVPLLKSLEGDKADCFYIVESGEVRIMMKSKTKADQQDNAEVEIARCSHGQYFGELALVTNKPRAASAYAVGGVKCLIMDIQAFERLLGSCKEIMKRNISHYEEQLVALFGSSMDLRD